MTPQPLLGHTSATLTTAIYGMLPIGALAGGRLGNWLEVFVAIWQPVALFGLSTRAILLSAMPRLMPAAIVMRICNL